MLQGRKMYTTTWTRSFNFFRDHCERGGRGCLKVDAGKEGGTRITMTLELPGGRGEMFNSVQRPPRTWKPAGRRKRDAERREAWLRRRREAWLERRGERGELAGAPANPLCAPASQLSVSIASGQSTSEASLGTGEGEKVASSKYALDGEGDVDDAGVEEMTSPLVPRSRSRPLSTSPIPQVDGINADSEEKSESEEDDDRTTSFCRGPRRRRISSTEEEDSGADNDALPWNVYRLHQIMSKEDSKKNNWSATPHRNSAGKRRPTRSRP